MSSEELISVIIPVYNVEAYLKQCIDSVLKQSYQNLQIILVDDGSTDNCGKICDAFGKKDDRIEIIHQKNKGLSAARNSGLAIARGEYIAFIDSDDYVAETFLSSLYKLLIQYDAQIACCDYICSKREPHFSRQNNKVQIVPSKIMLQEWHGVHKRIETVTWNKLYRRELFFCGDENIRFPEGRNHEDVCTTHRLIAACTKVVIAGQKMYFYRKRKDSIINRKITAKEIEDTIYAHRVRLDFFRAVSEQAYSRLLVGAQKYRMMYYMRAKGKQELKTQCQELADMYKKDESAVINLPYCTVSEKLVFQVFSCFLHMCR